MTFAQAQRNYDMMEAPEPDPRCVCKWCETVVEEEDDLHYYDGDHICDDCLADAEKQEEDSKEESEKFTLCEVCGKELTENEVHYEGKESLCDECYKQKQ